MRRAPAALGWQLHAEKRPLAQRMSNAPSPTGGAQGPGKARSVRKSAAQASSVVAMPALALGAGSGMISATSAADERSSAPPVSSALAQEGHSSAGSSPSHIALSASHGRTARHR